MNSKFILLLVVLSIAIYVIYYTNQINNKQSSVEKFQSTQDCKHDTPKNFTGSNEKSMMYFAPYMVKNFSLDNMENQFAELLNKNILTKKSLEDYEQSYNNTSGFIKDSVSILNNTRNDMNNSLDVNKKNVGNVIVPLLERKNNLDASLNKMDNTLAKISGSYSEDTYNNFIKNMLLNKIDSKYSKYQTDYINNNTTSTLNTLANNRNTYDINPLFDWRCEKDINTAPIRLNPVTGKVEVYSTNGSTPEAGYCAKNNNNTIGIDPKTVKPIVCTDEEKYNKDHWCNKAAKAIFNDESIVDASQCPENWTLVDDDANICMPPPNSDFNVAQNKEFIPKDPSKYSSECTDRCISMDMIGQSTSDKVRWSVLNNAFFPMKTNFTEKTRFINNLDTLVDTTFTNIVGTPPFPSRLENYQTYKKGVNVKVYNRNADGTRDNNKIIFENIFTTNINDSQIVTNVVTVLSGFIKIPNGVNSVKFEIDTDCIVVFKIKIGSNNTEPLNEVINNRVSMSNNTSDNINVTPNSLVQYELEVNPANNSTRYILKWALNGSAITQIISRDLFYLDSKRC